MLAKKLIAPAALLLVVAGVARAEDDATQTPAGEPEISFEVEATDGEGSDGFAVAVGDGTEDGFVDEDGQEDGQPVEVAVAVIGDADEAIAGAGAPGDEAAQYATGEGEGEDACLALQKPNLKLNCE